MPVTLLPPRTSSYGIGGPRPLVLTRGPRYFRGARSGYWHRTRSGVILPTTSWRPHPRTSLRFFCGQASDLTDGIARDDNPDDGAPLCGTCIGRAIGAGLDDPITGRELKFTPRWLTPPAVCPGSMDEHLVTPDPGNRTGTCLVCGEHDRCRSAGSPYSPRWGIQKHPPGPGLIPACPFHGWAYVALVDGRVGCHGCHANDPHPAPGGSP